VRRWVNDGAVIVDVNQNSYINGIIGFPIRNAIRDFRLHGVAVRGLFIVPSCHPPPERVTEGLRWGETVVGDSDSTREARRFGSYLRRLRETRRLSLDAVEEMSAAFPERITKSHLSRIENGLAEPSFRRLCALSRVYGVPVTQLAERFEIDLKMSNSGADGLAASPEKLRAELSRLSTEGRIDEALQMADLHVVSVELGIAVGEWTTALPHLRAWRAQALLEAGYFGAARDEAEELLDRDDLPERLRAELTITLVSTCIHTQRYLIARLAVADAERLIAALPDAGRLPGDLAFLKGNVALQSGEYQRAAAAYSEAAQHYERLEAPYARCQVRRLLGCALMAAGQHRESQDVLSAALAEAARLGYEKVRALIAGDLGELAWRRDDLASAEAYCLQSNAIARPREFLSIVFRNCYYLWQIALRRNDTAAATIHQRTLGSYFGRVDRTMTEWQAYRDSRTGGQS